MQNGGEMLALAISKHSPRKITQRRKTFEYTY